MIGRSNVGKSTFINSILNRRDIARVSQAPGKTQAIHFYLINELFYIVDLPGYGYAKVPRDMRHAWGDLIHTYLETAETLKMLFILLDSRRVPSPEDRQMLDWADASGIETRLVLTKTDKVSKNELAKNLSVTAAALGRDQKIFIGFSKLNRSGVDVVWRELLTHINENKRSNPAR